MQPLLILTTGGTFDKVHDSLTEALIFSDQEFTQIPEVLRLGKCFFPTQQSVLQKDSLDMTDHDREIVLNTILEADQSQIVLTHGTGTMQQTAEYLDGKVAGKTVVITGAMRPHSLGKSDAGFNLGGAVIAAQTLAHGVYAVMNGRVFAAKKIRKNVSEGRFDL